MFEQIRNAELAGIWTKVELDLTFPLQQKQEAEKIQRD